MEKEDIRLAVLLGEGAELKVVDAGGGQGQFAMHLAEGGTASTWRISPRGCCSWPVAAWSSG